MPNALNSEIVAVTVVIAVWAALASTQLAMTATRADLERVLLENDRDDICRMAAMLASKLDTLQHALKALARATNSEQLDYPARDHKGTARQTRHGGAVRLFLRRAR